MSEHTPGPWIIDEFLEDQGLYKIRGADAVLCHAHSFAESGTDAEALANARLIAAAPELLEALKETSARLRIHMKHTEDLVADMRACAAIAKAEGRR